MAQYALDDAVGIPVGICVVLSTELNADRISYLFGLSSVISKTDNKTCDIKFPLLSLVRVTVDNIPLIRTSISIRIFSPIYRVL